MGNANPARAKRLLKKTLYSHKVSLQKIREEYDSIFFEPSIPNRVDVKEDEFRNIKMDFLHPLIAGIGRCLLYVHGGWFVNGSRKSYRSFAASLSTASESMLVLPEYRLSPEFPFPAALEDVYNVYSYLCEHKNISPSKIILCGDGAGAAMATSLVHYLKKKDLPIPAGLVLISPWLDVSLEKLEGHRKKDLFLNTEILENVASLYVGEGNTSDPLISPLRGKVEKFPPVFIQACVNEMLYSDAKRFVEKLEAAGVPFEVDEWDKLWHFFQSLPEFAPDAHIAVGNLGNAIMRIFNKSFTEDFMKRF
ncbi:MAG: N-acetylphosphinothricin-tripetide-deacetylase [Treponema sp.]|nr:MAG: N-acetylphosphinothricin-tripetide-deacetylase [Treponema sp.]